MLKTYFIFTLGCQMNLSDSERVEAVLSSLGLKSGPEKSADLIIVNSCSVRQKPTDRIWGKLKVWQRINPKAKKILTGCVLPADLKKFRPKADRPLAEKNKFDYFFKIDELSDFNRWLEKYLTPRHRDKKKKIDNYLEMTAEYGKNDVAHVPIMSGCNNFCSYCAVPYTRGREWSRKPEKIINEVECLAKKGYKKIMLLGQNVCSYRNPKSKIPNPKQIQNPKVKIQNNDFSELLRGLVKIKGDFTLSFMSPHPKDFSDELIDLIAREKKISKEIHLPLQSGDDKILQKMNRGYQAAGYLNLVKRMKKKIKGLRISTDIIVGFPGESKKNFKNTVKTVKDANFSKAYVSIYSPRPGTVADKKFEDSVSAATKRKRWLMLDNMINKKDSR